MKNFKSNSSVFVFLCLSLFVNCLQAQTPTVSSLQATGTGIRWYSAATGGTLYTGTEALVHGQTYYASQIVNGCESTERVAVTANLITVSAPAAGTHSPSLTQIIWNWNTVSGATGYKWGATSVYADATDMGTALTKTETGLTCSTPYSRYIWAYNASGCVSGSATLAQSTATCVFPCGSSLTIDHVVSGGVAPVDKTVTYGTVTNIPGETTKCWITSNLGSDHQATAKSDDTEASAGWYWQFNIKQGYKHDGTTLTPSTTWISSINETSDWITANDPCNIELGNTWHIPTYSEWNNVDASGSWADWDDPWDSGLKIHAAGFLDGYAGSLDSRGSYGLYWSSTQKTDFNGYNLYFKSDNSFIGNFGKTYGFPARCVKDN